MGSVDYGVRSMDLVCSDTGPTDYDKHHISVSVNPNRSVTRFVATFARVKLQCEAYLKASGVFGLRGGASKHPY